MYERKCIVCGTEYRYCSHCGEFNPNEKWRYLYCGEECQGIYKTCEDFINTNKPSVDVFKAKNILDKLNVSKVKNSTVKETLDRIYAVKIENNTTDEEELVVRNKRKNKKKKDIVNEKLFADENASSLTETDEL